MNIFTAAAAGLAIVIKKIGIGFKAVLTGMKILIVSAINFVLSVITAIINAIVSAIKWIITQIINLIRFLFRKYLRLKLVVCRQCRMKLWHDDGMLKEIKARLLGLAQNEELICWNSGAVDGSFSLWERMRR